jgi:tetrahydromethanopterin S-methyltransferase subunit B
MPMKVLDDLINSLDPKDPVTKKLIAMRDLPGTIKEMRAKQNEYFKTRNHLILDQSKKLERQVDQMVKVITEQQTTMF